MIRQTSYSTIIIMLITTTWVTLTWLKVLFDCNNSCSWLVVLVTDTTSSVSRHLSFTHHILQAVIWHHYFQVKKIKDNIDGRLRARHFRRELNDFKVNKNYKTNSVSKRISRQYRISQLSCLQRNPFISKYSIVGTKASLELIILQGSFGKFSDY